MSEVPSVAETWQISLLALRPRPGSSLLFVIFYNAGNWTHSLVHPYSVLHHRTVLLLLTQVLHHRTVLPLT